jgi:hypothetical protein
MFSSFPQAKTLAQTDGDFDFYSGEKITGNRV